MLMSPELTPELKQYYEEVLAMLASPGWSFFLEDVQELRDSYNNVQTIPNGEVLQMRKGQLDILDWVLDARRRFEEAYSQLKEAES